MEKRVGFGCKNSRFYEKGDAFNQETNFYIGNIEMCLLIKIKLSFFLKNGDLKLNFSCLPLSVHWQ